MTRNKLDWDGMTGCCCSRSTIYIDCWHTRRCKAKGDSLLTCLMHTCKHVGVPGSHNALMSEHITYSTCIPWPNQCSSTNDSPFLVLPVRPGLLFITFNPWDNMLQHISPYFTCTFTTFGDNMLLQDISSLHFYNLWRCYELWGMNDMINFACHSGTKMYDIVLW